MGITISEIFRSRPVGEQMQVSGWVRTRRDSKAGGGLSFLEVNDGSCLRNLQVIANSTLANYASEIQKILPGACVRVEGRIIESPAQGQAVELHADQVTVLGGSDESYPIQKKATSLEFLREKAHLRPRTNTIGAVMRIRSTLAMAIHRYFQDRGFLYVHTPIITGSDCEGAGQMFRVTTIEPGAAAGDGSEDFFGRRTHLTVSGQLEAEAYALAFTRTYTFGPTFRAENSNTARHLAEFWMIEPEVAFADIVDNMNLAEDFLKTVIREALEQRDEDIRFLDQRFQPGLRDDLLHIVETPFARMTYTEALEHLAKADVAFEKPVAWGDSLQTEHERYLAEKLLRKPLILTDYPKDVAAFYMRLNEDGKTVRAMDVLVPRIGEIIGGSQREEREDKLRARLAQLGLPEKDYEWYLELRHYGSAPHSGFGLGFERLVLLVTGMANIRDVIPYPRTPKHAEF